MTSACCAQLVGNASTEAGDVALSYLPLSHIYEQFVEVMLMMSGVGIGYACGDMTRLIEDIQILKPHVSRADQQTPLCATHTSLRRAWSRCRVYSIASIKW
jgi:hypothetical protein